MCFGRNLERYLSFQVKGKPAPRAPRRKPRRGPARNWKYRAWIRTLPSAVSGRSGCEAAHTRNNGMRSKGSDYSCVPLTPAEHREYDAGRDSFERKYGISMGSVVKELNHTWFNYAGQVK